MNTFKHGPSSKALAPDRAATSEFTKFVLNCDLFTTAEAANYVRLAKSTLDRRRCGRRGPRYCKLGGAVRYRRVDLDAWLESCLQSSTRENK